MPISHHSVRTQHGVLPYTIKRARRAKFTIKITYDGIVVRANLSEPISSAEHIIQKFSQWFSDKLAEIKGSRPTVRNHWELGKTILYLGRHIELQQHFTHDTPLFMGDIQAPQDGDILLVDDVEYKRLGITVQDSCEYWLKQQAYQWFSNRLAWFEQEKGIHPRSFRLSKAMSSWGQCNNKGVIGLNWRLIHLAPEQIDYVIAHELAHLKHMNHSRQFWQEVAQLMPGYEPHKKALRENSLHFLT